MPKTIAITPSWYWPEAVERVTGIPPFSISELCLYRHAVTRPDHPAIIQGSVSLTFGELEKKVSGACKSLIAESPDMLIMDSGPGVDNLILLLAALTVPVMTRLVPPEKPEYPDAAGKTLDARNRAGEFLMADPQDSSYVPAFSRASLSEPVLVIPGKNQWIKHSQRSLLASAISFHSFIQPDKDRSWLSGISLDRWEGLMAALCPLYAGNTLILASPDDPMSWVAAIGEHQPGYALVDFEPAAMATRDAKKEAKQAREVLSGLFLSTDGLFDPGERQRIGKSFRCPALTLFGSQETGAIFAAHPLWYMDESIGIPVTNAHVVPADPRTGSPIQTLWELVESAEVTVQGPAVACGYEGGDNQPFLTGGRFRTRVIASSDANGMVYILPD